MAMTSNEKTISVAAAIALVIGIIIGIASWMDD
jgi:uncharacterized membrane-anchored protein YhcB (DUF1043 family)